VKIKTHLCKVKFDIKFQNVENKKFVEILYQNGLRESACVRHNDNFNGGCGRIRDTDRDDTHG